MVAYLKTLFREAKKLDLISHAEYVDGLMADRADAKEAGNWTAAASFQRLIGQAIGSLEQNITVNERAEPAELIKRIASDNPTLAEHLERLLSGRRDFDA